MTNRHLGKPLAVLAGLVLSASALAQSTEEKLDALSREVEALRKEVAGKEARPEDKRTHIGGYGELHYNNLDTSNRIDFHRFVLFFGHRFSDRIRFNSEIEFEHSLIGDDKPGEVELEQAYLDFDFAENHTARAGLFLIPIGILNETHEPPTFYGVERNPVESNIIPTTWWEGGASVYGNLTSALRYDLAVTSGLRVPTTGSSAFSIRSGRQKVANATANNAAYTGRLKWTGVPGVELGTTLHYQDDLTQEDVPGGVSATLAEAHVALARGPWGLRALYAQWNLDGAAPEAVGRDKQKGWYIEPSYKVNSAFGVFARYSQWDTEAGDGIDSKKKQTDVGFNYWPHEQVVVKFDVQRQSGAVDNDGFNIGLGYMF